MKSNNLLKVYAIIVTLIAITLWNQNRILKGDTEIKAALIATDSLVLKIQKDTTPQKWFDLSNTPNK